MTAVIETMKAARLSGVALLLMLAACAYVLWPSAQNEMTSEDVVQQIVARADGKNAEVDRSFLGDKVCFAAESAPGGHYAKIFFPDSHLSAIPGYEPSEGIWFLYIDRAKKARMFSNTSEDLSLGHQRV